jgi:hypothetical protein
MSSSFDGTISVERGTSFIEVVMSLHRTFRLSYLNSCDLHIFCDDTRFSYDAKRYILYIILSNVWR